MPELSATNTISEYYYLLLNYQSLCDAKAGFAECWLSTNKEQHMSANSTVQFAASHRGPHKIHTVLAT
jgi:hypothetical protein